MPSAVNSAAMTANMSARRLKRSVNSKILMLPRGVTGNGPKWSTLTATLDPRGGGIEMTGQRTINRGVFRAWYFEQWRNHQRVHKLNPTHKQKRSSMRSVRAVPRWQEAVEWQACMIQGRMINCTQIRTGSSPKRQAARPAGCRG